MAPKLLSTVEAELGQVALVPDNGGHFSISINETVIWERKRDGGFPDPKDIKQRSRDLIAPERRLGPLES